MYILDINVPNIDGITILEKIKSINQNSKAIIISANIDINQITLAYEKECDDYIKKPFDIEELRLIIGRLTKQFEIEKLALNFSFNLRTKILFENSDEIYLTKYEKNLLFLLLSNRAEKINHQQIEEFVYSGVAKTSTAIRTLVKRLRDKLPKDTILNSLDEGYYIK